MKTIDLKDATEPLAEYVKRMEGEAITIVHKGVPLAVLRPAGTDDYESVQMSTNPQFIELLERSRKSIREGRGFSTEEMKKMFEDDKDA
jgi:antitoxin (DNA-binding transcriptional repressor) of toxin-antitoxin stability system